MTPNDTGEEITKDFLSYRAYEVTSHLFKILRRIEVISPHSRHELKEFCERVTNNKIEKAKLNRPIRTHMVFAMFKVIAYTMFGCLTVKDYITDAWYWAKGKL